jgi:hypothetical protein
MGTWRPINDDFGFIKVGEFLDQLSLYQLLIQNSDGVVIVS